MKQIYDKIVNWSNLECKELVIQWLFTCLSYTIIVTDYNLNRPIIISADSLSLIFSLAIGQIPYHHVLSV